MKGIGSESTKNIKTILTLKKNELGKKNTSMMIIFYK